MARDHRPDVDWLRVIATYLLFVFHVAKVFDPSPFYHIRNAELSMAMLVLAGFVSLWHMPLFFLLAGWSMVASLRRRGPGGLLRERIARLGVPLVAGCALFGPLIKYVELRSGLDLSHAGLRASEALQGGFRQVIPAGLPTAPPFTEGFVEFWPTFFTGLDRFTWSHLWFVAYLLAFTVFYLPALVWLLRRDDRIARVRVPWLYLPVVLLALIQLALRPRWPGIQNLYDDWANVAYYSTYLLAGFVLGRSPAIERAVHAEWRRALALGSAAALVLLLAVLGLVTAPSVLLVGSAVAGWCFVLAALGLAHRFLHAHTPALDYLSESAFPVYVLHQPAIVLAGFYLVLPLRAGVATKYVLLLGVSVAATLAVYHWLVRPFRVSRALLGMRVEGRRMPVRGTWPRVALLGLALLPPPTRAAEAPPPVGLWHAEGGAARVEIAPCGDLLCGRVVWLRSPFDQDGCTLRDANNPDPVLRTRSVIGLEIIRGLVPSPAGYEGTIYDPTSGRVYRCRVARDGPDRLRIRGYLGVPWIGRTTTWLRVGAEERLCLERAP